MLAAVTGDNDVARSHPVEQEAFDAGRHCAHFAKLPGDSHRLDSPRIDRPGRLARICKQVLREIVQGGEFPYWNRYFAAGQPIAANPEHEVFYPLTWLILLPSYNLGYSLHIALHIYIGLLGMYALLRSMELRPAAAWFGAMAFGLGGRLSWDRAA